MKTLTASIRRLIIAAAAVVSAVPCGGTAHAAPTIYISNFNSNSGYVSAFDATGSAAGGFTDPAGFVEAEGVAVDPATNTLYVADAGNSTISTYDATTGAATSIGFAGAAGLNGPNGLLLAGGNLLVANNTGGTVGEYGIPTTATPGNTPTFSNNSFLTSQSGPDFIAVAPEPSTWALLGIGTAGLGLATLPHRGRARAV